MMSTRATNCSFVRSLVPRVLAQPSQRQHWQSNRAKYASDTSIHPPVAGRKSLIRHAPLRQSNDLPDEDSDHSATEESSHSSDAADPDVAGGGATIALKRGRHQ
jgi:hypothetical protein